MNKINYFSEDCDYISIELWVDSSILKRSHQTRAEWKAWTNNLLIF